MLSAQNVVHVHLVMLIWAGVLKKICCTCILARIQVVDVCLNAFWQRIHKPSIN